MEQPFRAVKIADGVYWVGAIDWTVRDFHGYLTTRGTTYNAYLVMADRITLIDTVKAPFFQEMVSRISSVTDPADIRYIVSNHSEMDHSGCLPRSVELIKPEKVFASKMGVQALSRHFGKSLEVTEVEDGGSLDLGGNALRFLETRMLHWPDSMFSYLVNQGVLFSQDAFGMHLATSERFADEIPDEILRWEAAKYYANILLPFSTQVSKLLERVAGLDLAFNVIAPDHGPVWRKDTGTMPGLYAGWAAQKRIRKAVVSFATMWGSTATMAGAIAEGIMSGGAGVKVMPLSSCHRSDVATELLDAGAFVVGSPTMNNNMFPSVADLLTYIDGLKPRGMVGASFGSYGWSGQAVKQVREALEKMKVGIVSDSVSSVYVPDEKVLGECRRLGEAIAEGLPPAVV